MEADEGYNDDSLTGKSYSQLLFADDYNFVNLNSAQCYNFNSHSSSQYSPKMLCFGENRECYDLQLVKNSLTGVATPTSSDTNNQSAKISMNNKKRNGSLVKELSIKENSVNAASENQKNSKKIKGENSTFIGHAKVKKEKLGARITALQQIVSPFGKTDTASVLHEATGYIRFLHDQLQVLSSPYLHRLQASTPPCEGKEKMEVEATRDLRSRGLCLIPVGLTSHVAESNGADFWSPAMVKNVSPTSL